MRVVHLVHSFPPEFRGGTETCVERLALAQQERGDEPVVVAGSDERADPPLVRNDRVGPLDVRRVLRVTGENYSMDHRLPRVRDQVAALVDELEPDVVHVHHTLNLSGDLAAELDRRGHVVLATLHDFTLVCARFFLLRPDGDSCAEAFPLPAERCVTCVLPDFPAGREELERQTAARAANARSEARALRLAVAPSGVVHERWLRSGLFDADRLVTVPHPAPLDDAPPPPARVADGRLVLATWGHLAPAKGLLDLIEALRLVGDERLSLVIWGQATDDEHDRELRAAARGLPVEFGGAYGAADLATLRGRADAAVFPSRAEETFGLVVAEARALGFPVLASDRGALPEAVGEAGAVFPAARPAELARLLVALLADPSPLQRWAAASRRDLLGSADHADRMAALYARARERP